jgi:hypothetical protein
MEGKDEEEKVIVLRGSRMSNAGEPLVVAASKYPYLADLALRSFAKVFTVPLDDWRACLRIRRSPKSLDEAGNFETMAVFRVRKSSGETEALALGRGALLHISSGSRLEVAVAQEGRVELSHAARYRDIKGGSSLMLERASGEDPSLRFEFQDRVARLLLDIGVSQRGVPLEEAVVRGIRNPYRVSRTCPACLAKLKFTEAEKSKLNGGRGVPPSVWLDPRVRILCCSCYKKAMEKDALDIHPLLL